MNALLQAIFGLLCVEVVLVVLFVSPLPLRAQIVRCIASSNALASLTRPVVYFFGLVVLTWLFTTREMLRLQSEYQQIKVHADLGAKLQHEARMFRAQRDFYLAGFAALLLLVIRQLYGLLKDVNQLEATKEAMKKQAEGASAAYKSVSAEKDALAKQLKAEGGEATAATEDATEELQEKLTAAEKARDAAEKSAEALKKQAEGLSTEYSRLTREKESLDNKLADFEMLMGDSNKKAK